MTDKERDMAIDYINNLTVSDLEDYALHLTELNYDFIDEINRLRNNTTQTKTPSNTQDLMTMFVDQFIAEAKVCKGMNMEQCELLSMELVGFLENNTALREYIFQQVLKEGYLDEIRFAVEDAGLEVDDTTMQDMADYYELLQLEGYSGDFAIDKTFEKFWLKREEKDV